MIARFLLFLSLALAAPAATAQEFITVPGPISDEAFYRLVSCAAPSGAVSVNA